MSRFNIPTAVRSRSLARQWTPTATRVALITLLLVGAASLSAQSTDGWGGRFALRAVPDVAAFVYGGLAAVGFSTASVISSDASGNVVHERDFAYASTSGALLWTAGNAIAVIRSYASPADERRWRAWERWLTVGGLGAMALYTLSPQYDGDEARGMLVTLAAPMALDLLVGLLPYPR